MMPTSIATRVDQLRQWLEAQQLENLHTIANLEMQVKKLQKKNMFPANLPEEEECISCSA